MAQAFITHVIIPAAGFGKRVGSPESKELMIYKPEGQPVIQWSLDLCKEFGFKPIVITRSDKTQLNEYLEKNKTKYNLDICAIPASEEWTHSVQLSQSYWGQKNILLLPDSRFEPTEILEKLEQALDSTELCFATFKVEDLSHWGVVAQKNLKTYIVEKPVEVVNYENPKAWGLIGFNKNAGAELFSLLRQSSQDHKFKMLTAIEIDFLDLIKYKDITRDLKDLK